MLIFNFGLPTVGNEILDNICINHLLFRVHGRAKKEVKILEVIQNKGLKRLLELLGEKLPENPLLNVTDAQINAEKNDRLLRVCLYVTTMRSHPGMKLVMGLKRFCLQVNFLLKPVEFPSEIKFSLEQNLFLSLKTYI